MTKSSRFLSAALFSTLCFAIVLACVGNPGSARAALAAAKPGPDCWSATPGPQIPPAIASAMLRAIHTYSGHVPGVGMVVIMNGKRYPFYAGYAKRNQTCMDAHTIMEIGSVTKTFTAMLLAMAYANVTPSPPVGVTPSPIPAVNPQSTPIGLMSALTQGASVGAQCGAGATPSPVPPASYGVLANGNLSSVSAFDAGLPDDPTWEPKGGSPCMSPDQFINYVTAYGRPNPSPSPTTYPYVYSNSGYGALGYVLQGVYNRSWWDLTQNMILQPLNMKHTYILPHAPTQNYAQGYTCLGAPAQKWTLNPWPAGGAIGSTLEDMAPYLQAAMQISGNTTIDAAAKTSEATIWTNEQTGWQQAMSWYTVKDKLTGWDLTQKDGATNGFNSWIGMFLPQGDLTDPIGIVVLTNRAMNPPHHSCKRYPAPANQIGQRVLEMIAPTPQPTSTPIP